MKRLCENVYDLVFGADMLEMNNVILDFITHEMTIHLDVFGALMENMTIGNMDDTLIIAEDGDRARM